MEGTILISIVTPVYNAERSILDCMESVLNQTYSNFEHILIDDRSTDGSYELVTSLSERDKRIRNFRLSTNSGAGIARSFGLKKSRGRFIAFLDSDDVWDKSKLNEQLAFCLSEKIKFSYTNYWTFNEDNVLCSNVPVRDSVSKKDILKTCDIYTSTVLIEKELLSTNLSLIRKRQDFVSWVNVLCEVEKAYALKIPLTGYRISKTSLSGNKFKIARVQWGVYRNELNLSLSYTIYLFIFYSFNGLRKRLLQTKGGQLN